MANDPDAMLTMLNYLHWYAQGKHLIINTAKSEVVHFNHLVQMRLHSTLRECRLHTKIILI